MITLAISTSSKICSVALMENDKLVKELNINADRTHVENLMPLIKELLDLEGVTMEDINLIACDNGPRLLYRD